MLNVTNEIDSGPEPPVCRTATLVSPSLELFSRPVQGMWALVMLLTVAPELLPVAPMPLGLFCLYYFLKIGSFFALGLLAPLALQSLNSIGVGLLLAFFSAFMIESLQGLLGNGHVFHWYELIGKLALIALGFATGIECRYTGKIQIGRIPIRLDTDEV